MIEIQRIGKLNIVACSQRMIGTDDNHEMVVPVAAGTTAVPVSLRLRRPAPMQHGY